MSHLEKNIKEAIAALAPARPVPIPGAVTYAVGGGVRDAVMGRPPSDLDFAVTGATPEQMEALGFTMVGKDFPVFLHPETGDEYALARVERKTGDGHRGFSVRTGPDVSIADDLSRRDLTVNSMAVDQDGNLVDPFGGLADIASKTLRMTGPAFREDPLRVFRCARFAATTGFSVEPSTMAAMSDMAIAGELSHLPMERIFAEVEKAVASRADIEILARVLSECHALESRFPASSGLVSRGAPRASLAISSGLPPHAVWGAWVSGEGPEKAATASAEAGVPTEWRDCAVVCARILQSPSGTPAERMSLFKSIDASRRGERAALCIGTLASSYPEHVSGDAAASLLHSLDAFLSVDAGAAASGFSGREAGLAVDRARLLALESSFPDGRKARGPSP